MKTFLFITPEVYLRTCQTSTMELFSAKIVSGSLHLAKYFEILRKITAASLNL